jgi:hypothetical protein
LAPAMLLGTGRLRLLRPHAVVERSKTDVADRGRRDPVARHQRQKSTPRMPKCGYVSKTRGGCQYEDLCSYGRIAGAWVAVDALEPTGRAIDVARTGQRASAAAIKITNSPRKLGHNHSHHTSPTPAIIA